MPKIANIAIFQTTPQPVLAVRKQTDVAHLPNEIGEVYGLIAAYLSKTGAFMADVPFCHYHSMDMERIDVSIGFPVASEMPGDGAIESYLIPSQKVVCGIHQGPYAESAALYDEMAKYIADHGLEAAGDVYEYYLNDPDRPEADLLTKILMPLK